MLVGYNFFVVYEIIEKNKPVSSSMGNLFTKSISKSAIISALATKLNVDVIILSLKNTF